MGTLPEPFASWFARPLVGLVVGTVVSTVLFSAAHGSPDVWVLGSIGCLAVASCLATWRTGLFLLCVPCAPAKIPKSYSQYDLCF